MNRNQDFEVSNSGGQLGGFGLYQLSAALAFLGFSASNDVGARQYFTAEVLDTDGHDYREI